MRSVRIRVGGMSCQGCVASLTRVLSRIPGVNVERVAVGSAELAYDDAATSEAALRDAVARAGFETESIEAR